MEWGGLDGAREYAEKGYALITNDPYQFGLAGEVFSFTEDFGKAAASFAKLFDADDNPGDTFTSFYMQSSYLNNDFDMVETLADRIISENKSRKIDNCFRPFCGNAGYAYLFLIYVTNNKNDNEKVSEYLDAFRKVRNKYTREMWMSNENPFHGIWTEEATKITKLIDDLGW